MVMSEDRIDGLERTIAELRTELLREWEANHAEHCGRWPHEPGQRCHWPQPEILHAVK